MFRTKNFYTKNTFTIGIILLFILLIFRAISIYFKLPRPIYYSNLFNSNAFALSEINPSLGDFLINSFLLLLLVLFIYFRLKKVELEKYNMFIVNILLIILSLFSLALFINSILSIYVGSQYLFDLKLNFSLSDWTFKIAVILVFIINASIYLFIQNLVVSGFRKIDLSKTMLATFILSIIFLSSLLIYFFEFSILFLLLNLAYCFIIFRLNYQLSINKYSYKLLVYLGVTALFCSIYSTIIDYKQSLNSEFLKKQQFGKSKLEDNDKMGEFLIEIADESIKNSDPIKKNLGERAINFDLIDKEVKNVHLKNWFDKYEIKIYYYDVNGKNLKNRFADSYEIKWNNYLTKGENTIIDNLIFIPGDQYSNTKKYLNRIRLTTNNNSQITLLILLEGIKKNSEIDKFMGVNPGKNLKYNFYVFSNIDTDDVGSLNNDYQKGNVKNLLLNPEIYNKVLTINGINYAAFRNPAGESVLVFSSEKLFSEIFIDFLFLFTILLIVFILGLLLVAIFRNTKIFEQSYSSKIQAYFGLIFFVPFLISIVLIFQVINKSSKEKEKINTEALVNKITNEFLKLTEIAPLNIKNKYFWEDEIVDLKAKFNSDLHIYNLDGIFLSGSGFIKKSLSKNTISAIDLASKNANNLLFEKDGSIYKYILNKNGRKLGIFAIPNFLFASSESNEIHNLLRSIFSTFALLFLLFLAFSIFISEKLTKPLKLITNYLQNTDLQNTNRPINWKAKDEIGLLVNGYNAMLEKIELGKMEISKQEKQSAWQDIARQVAHEIKNPLTPMKLNLQFLNNSIEKSEGKSKEILEKNIKNLLYNIENITEIVDSFSDYARMPLPKLVKVDLVKTLELAYLNFKNTEGIALNLNLKLKNAYVQGDEKVLFQIFNNLIINALQSVKIGSMPDIRIELKKVAQKYIFSFVDNGTGISEELQKKVFLPNFSTKKEGSGVGLSLAKWGIENMNGKIWFETEINKGTCFFIELDEA